MTELNNLVKRNNRKYKSKRLGRGYGSGVGGHTVGRGQKGQLSRSGHKSMLGFEGGNVPLYKKLPKFRGFKSSKKERFSPVNISQLDEKFKDGSVIDLKSLKEVRLIKNSAKLVKILGIGDTKKKFTVEGIALSKSAEEKITKNGGSVK